MVCTDHPTANLIRVSIQLDGLHHPFSFLHLIYKKANQKATLFFVFL